MLNKRGVHMVEYALILAFVCLVGTTFTAADYHQLLTHPFTKLESMIEGKKDIAVHESFWQAIGKDKTKIVYNGKTYTGILEYITNSGSNFTSGSIGSGFKGISSTVDGVKYDNASEPIHKILADNNYIGHEDITWSVIGNTLSVYEDSKLTLADVGNTYKVMCYDLKNPTKPPVEKTAKFVKSGKGEYGYLNPQ